MIDQIPVGISRKSAYAEQSGSSSDTQSSETGSDSPASSALNRCGRPWDDKFYSWDNEPGSRKSVKG